VPPALRNVGHTIACAKDGWVFHKGDPVRAVFLVLDGEVHLSRFAKDGSEIALHTAGRGEFFAEAAVNTPRYHCNAIASRPTTLLAFSVDKIRALLANDPDFAREWVALLARQLQDARARLERLALKSSAERVLHYLRTEGKGPRCEVVLTGTIKEFAHELGLTHENLYRTLARLEQQGVVSRDDSRLFLL
jgi:CRP-like cAMP-binding protein